MTTTTDPTHRVYTQDEYIPELLRRQAAHEAEHPGHPDVADWVRPLLEWFVQPGDDVVGVSTVEGTYRNVHQFSDGVPETKHHGHRVAAGEAFVPDEGEPENRMRAAYCLECGEAFDAFAEEIEVRA